MFLPGCQMSKVSTQNISRDTFHNIKEIKSLGLFFSAMFDSINLTLFTLCQAPDQEKTGILGSWILRNIFKYHHIEKHFDLPPAYFLNLQRMRILLAGDQPLVGIFYFFSVTIFKEQGGAELYRLVKA